MDKHSFLNIYKAIILYMNKIISVGCYLLIIELKTSQKLQIGKLGTLFFKKGFYVYIGSAMNGLEKRIRRHLCTQKKTYWHIDYLLPVAEHIDVFYQENNIKKECDIAQVLAANLQGVPCFGCSDCSCQSHLFSGSKHAIMLCVYQLDMNPYFSDANA